MSGREVTMVRKLRFAAGHRYWLPDLSEAENRATFGPFASPFNHGHTYGLEVGVRGEVDASTGMVVNIKDIDIVVRRHVIAVYDGRSINDEVPGFATVAPTLENLLADIRTRIEPGLPPVCRLVSLLLSESPTLFAELDPTTMNTTLTRTYEFAAAHRLHAPSLSENENRDLFGKCNNAAGHGHNYILEVTVGGERDRHNGMIVDIERLDALVEEEVVGRYDHKNLNEDLPEFKDRSTSSENVAAEIFDRLGSPIDERLGVQLARVRLHETARNVFEVSR